MNSGERDELKLKIMLIHMRDNGILFANKQIHSVGFGANEYKSLNEPLDKEKLGNMKAKELKKYAKELGITKSPAGSKSDVYINGEGYSVKSYSAAPPAIVNHTHRSGFERACEYSGVEIKDLDNIIEEYWKLRQAGIIKEDIKNSDINSPFKDKLAIIEPVLQYFIFKGTGSRMSDHEAEFILDYSDPLVPSTWKVLDKNTIIDEVWDKLVFSMRSKGMPKSYPNMKNKAKQESIKKWTKLYQNKHKGSLHVRVSR